MKVLHITPYLYPALYYGGPAISVFNMGLGLIEQGIDLQIFTTDANGDGKLNTNDLQKQELNKYPFKYFHRDYNNKRFFSSPMAYHIATQIKRFDLVHIMGMWTFPSFLGFLFARRHHVPYVVSTRGCLDPWALEQNSKKKDIYFRIGLKKFLSGASALHFTSKREREVSPNWAKKIPYFIVPNGFEFNSCSSQKRGSFRQQLNLKDSDFLWGIVGRLHKLKGFDTLIPAFAKVLEKHPSAFLAIIGPSFGDYEKQICKMVNHYGVKSRVRFVGMLNSNDLIVAYCDIDTLVMPSYRENFGNTAVEAMAQGTPVLVSKNVNIWQEITEANAGIAVKKEVEPLANAMVKFMSEVHIKKMAENACNLAYSKYNITIAATNMIKEYEGIIKQGGNQ